MLCSWDLAKEGNHSVPRNVSLLDTRILQGFSTTKMKVVLDQGEGPGGVEVRFRGLNRNTVHRGPPIRGSPDSARPGRPGDRVCSCLLTAFRGLAALT